MGYISFYGFGFSDCVFWASGFESGMLGFCLFGLEGFRVLLM